MSDVVCIPGGGLVGWRLLKDEPPIKEEGSEEERPAQEEGLITAFRKNGDEALFCSREEKPTIWIPVGDFVIEPATIPEFEYNEEEVEAEGEPGGGPRVGPAKTSPFPVRRRDKK